MTLTATPIDTVVRLEARGRGLSDLYVAACIAFGSSDPLPRDIKRHGDNGIPAWTDDLIAGDTFLVADALADSGSEEEARVLRRAAHLARACAKRLAAERDEAQARALGVA